MHAVTLDHERGGFSLVIKVYKAGEDPRHPEASRARGREEAPSCRGGNLERHMGGAGSKQGWLAGGNGSGRALIPLSPRAAQRTLVQLVKRQLL